MTTYDDDRLARLETAWQEWIRGGTDPTTLQLITFQSPWGDESPEDIARLSEDGFEGGAWEDFALMLYGRECADYRPADILDLDRCGLAHTARIAGLNDALVAISRAIDAYPANAQRSRDDALQVRTTTKIIEEAGEVAEAVTGLLGANPRKGQTHNEDDVIDELYDLAVTALCAIVHIYDRVGVYPSNIVEALIARVNTVKERIET